MTLTFSETCIEYSISVIKELLLYILKQRERTLIVKLPKTALLHRCSVMSVCFQ